MTSQSKSIKIDAENYVQIKQEANAKQAHNTDFGPFQPKKSIATPGNKRFMSRTFKTSTNTLAQDLATSLVPTVTKKYDPKEQHEPSKSKDVVEETCKENEDPKEQDEASKEMEIKLPGRRKQVCRPGANVHWKENIDVDPDELIQVEGRHTWMIIICIFDKNCVFIIIFFLIEQR